jgi:hypothetical protein
VDAVRPRGSQVELTIRATADGGARFTVRIPVHEGADYREGMPVSVTVAGGCVLYPVG